MKLLNTKPRPPADTVTPAELIAALERKRADLQRRDRELLAAQLRLERGGVEPSEPTIGIDPQDIAREIVGDGSPRLAAAESASAQLRSIILQRQAIKTALDILSRDETKARALAVAAVMQQRGEDWRAIVRRRALALIELRAANRAADEFRRDVQRVAKNIVSLVCDRHGGVMFTATGMVGDAVYVFLQDCQRAGIIDERDIDAT